MLFYDTPGADPNELRRPYLQVADAYLLVYSICDEESFHRMDALKKFIEKHISKERKELPIVVVGTMGDLCGQRRVDAEFAMHWASREKGGRGWSVGRWKWLLVRLFEVSARDRASLIDVVHCLSGKYFNTLSGSWLG